ncbi:MAG: outer membrane protein insertion porin family [Granulosicoccus sp.]
MKDDSERQVIRCMSKLFRIWAIALTVFVSFTNAQGQIQVGGSEILIDYASPRQYTIGGITVSGTKYLDKRVLTSLSGLTVGDTVMIPGEAITVAIENLWDQGLFSTVDIKATKVLDEKIFLNISLQERPRLLKFALKGIRKSEANDIREKIKLIKGKVVTDNLKISTTNTIKDHFIDKGFYNISVEVKEDADSILRNNVVLTFKIDKKKKVKINKVTISGNEKVKATKLKRQMKETKEKKFWRVWKASKFILDDYKIDKLAIIAKYNQLGYRDAVLTRDSVYRSGRHLTIEMEIEEGNKYYFRNISWVGNTKYKSEVLNKILAIKKGEIFDQARLEANLFMNPNGRDVSSLYLDDGYLFFNVNPVEVLVENDSIDLEMRIHEGKQATISKVIVKGNTKTNDHVILRELRTKPGQLFSRADIIRSQRELSQLGYFDPEQMGVEPKPDPVTGTVDIEYTVVERPSDQIELSGGWGAGRIVGTLGVSFNNFSTRNMFKKGAWRPLPAGDGQKLSLRAQSNGLFFQSYNASFTEPWLGGKKPNSLSVSVFHSIQSNGLAADDEARSRIQITGASIGLGKRLKWPDDFFILQQQINYQHYALDGYQLIDGVSNGNSNAISYGITLSRNSIGDPIFPTSGGVVSLSVEATPPVSSFTGLDYSVEPDSTKYQWIEYHKWKFDTKWYQQLAKNLVIQTKVQFGFLGSYNEDLESPFERFYVGGDGLSGFGLDGREIIALRGYDNNSISAEKGSFIFAKYNFELRYRISANPSATIFVLGFLEAGDAWSSFQDFQPFNVKKSAGVGLRLFLPMFGLLGLDYGWRFDDIPGQEQMAPGQFHFSIGQQF